MKSNPPFRLLCLLAVVLIPVEAGAQNKRKTIKEIREKAEPGPNHALLDPCVGEWKVRMQYRLKPDSNPETAVGKAEIRWILGKRFLEQTIEGKGAAGSLEGIGLIGYDNIRKKYTATWINTMSTGQMRATGAVAGDRRTFQFKATATDPIDGKEKQFDMVFRIVDANTLQYLVYAPNPDGGDRITMMNIGYQRK
ncbi:MAG: DUF1579 family protein [Verrucomicrobiales bacterium]|nr:DUF1579 family protein [Verrucomicrobiales bacterium]